MADHGRGTVGGGEAAGITLISASSASASTIAVRYDQPKDVDTRYMSGNCVNMQSNAVAS
eukprot:CAMPEP_0179439586 /NCGR_PEP_ID=MMETSP0799-20121207/23213_1 /TAXON_ID=46947 /ORGANISM="Geminigera cryophila, Strain CCMP2564" /LENGTH=59 /DNA_ID=CAMNT_0021222139 /DNA_START=153 /DNA_END=329 /DNA_ORIENTATION=+